MTPLGYLRTALLASLGACSGNGSNTSPLLHLPECEQPTELADGIVQCADGSIDRVVAGTFDPTITADRCEGTEDDLSCTTDADCTAAPNGACLTGRTYYYYTGETSTCGCSYACASDADCGDGQACLPAGLVGGPAWPQCYAASCTSSDDCGNGGICGVGEFLDDCGNEFLLACRTEADTCRSDSDCGQWGQCFPSDDGWYCLSDQCTVG